MKSCLLCLKINRDMIGAIEVNSVQWETENINQLIEKYLWPMDTTQPSAWMCTECWRKLYDFHKFYKCIEEAHSNLVSALKGTDEDKAICTKYEHNVEYKDCIDSKEDIVDNYLETEILMEHPMTTEFMIENENLLIKEEQKDEVSSEDIPLKQRRKRGRPPKNMINNLENINTDPLRKMKKQKPPAKSKKIKDTINIPPIETITKVVDNNESAVNQKTQVLETSSDHNALVDTVDNYNTDTESEYQDDKRSENCRKKRKNPDEKTRKEYDKIIAEHFQIFCSLCQISIENFIALRKHFREEHKKRGFVICCKKKIFTRPILVDHINFHLDPNYFKCKYCEKVYSERSTMEGHMKIHVNGQNDRNHSCDICGKVFVGATRLENHKLTHAPDYEKKFSCTECGKYFTTLYSLNYHIQAIHHNKYVKICDICGKTMRCRNSFKLHMEKHDNKLATPINCDICGLRLIDRRGLRRHKNSQHPVGGKKEYSCHICSKISPNLRALRTHVRFAHETGYIHKCTMCDKAFKRPEALKEHMATHTGTALYTCPWCPKTFISNGNMHNHRKKSHPKEWEEAQRQKYAGNLPLKYKSPFSTNSNKT